MRKRAGGTANAVFLVLFSVQRKKQERGLCLEHRTRVMLVSAGIDEDNINTEDFAGY
jgi:F420-0:gamma-glutamyl ligase